MTNHDNPSDTNPTERLQKAINNRQEVMPGITRGNLFLYGGGLFVYTVLVCALSFLVISINNNREQAEIAAGTEVAQSNTEAAQLATDVMETEIAGYTATPTPTSRNVFAQIGTVAPTATPTSDVEAASAFPPPPPNVQGVIVGWGGNNPASQELLPLRLYNAGAVDDFEELQGAAVRSVTADNSLQRSLYVASSPRTVGVDFLLRDLTLPNVETFPFDNLFESQGYDEPNMPHISQDGRFAVFVGENISSRLLEIYRYDFVNDVVVQLTSDEFNYTHPSLSADNTQVVAVQQNPRTNEQDIVILNAPLETAADVSLVADRTTITRLTTDGTTTLETMPAFSPLGDQVVYAAAVQDAPETHDIFLLPLGAAPISLVANIGDNIYPKFSPDGQYIVYASDAFGAYDLFIQAVASSDTYQLTTTTNRPDFPGVWVTGEGTPVTESGDVQSPPVVPPAGGATPDPNANNESGTAPETTEQP